ncbi:MAG TPA: DUF4124 domain-containing protein [Burkholderiales bacterium]|nr:DUF4124 domain-containing protein [Burkholderiales bacterium]
MRRSLHRLALYRLVLLFAGAAAMAPLHAQVYKWVDAKGVTHYSDKPPAGQAAKPHVVEERVSIIASDPALSAAMADMRAQGARRAELAQAEWLQRQRLMLAAQSLAEASYDCPYRVDCDSPFGYRYGYGYFGYAYPPIVATRSFPLPPPHGVRPPHVAPRAVPVRASRL